MDLLAALESVVGKLPPPTTPRHPAAGCPCDDCTRRDDRAEERALERRGY